jgi:hypothetical protein
MWMCCQQKSGVPMILAAIHGARLTARFRWQTTPDNTNLLTSAHIPRQ